MCVCECLRSNFCFTFYGDTVVYNYLVILFVYIKTDTSSVYIYIYIYIFKINFSSTLTCTCLCFFRWMTDDVVEMLTPLIVKPRPNTYTYTKAMAEYILQKERGLLPCAIIRPSIVGAALLEPYPVCY